MSAKEASVQALKIRLGLTEFVGQSETLAAQLQQIAVIAATDAAVLILGESGTGKELCAGALHRLSARAAGPLITVNCGSLPRDLRESAFFGHEAGAFTGALKSAGGFVEQAEGGTLFLDEIGTLPYEGQSMLLRLLQEKEYRSVGATRVFRANARIIAATNRDLLAASNSGEFRPDLYFRLCGLAIRMSPLRERAEDIPLLAREFLRTFSIEHRRPAADFHPSALVKLVSYHWPGNVRELQNVIRQAVLFSSGPIIEASEIRFSPLASEASGASGASGVDVPPASENSKSWQKDKKAAVAQFERTRIVTCLAAAHGNISEAARQAGKARRVFWELMRKYRINADDFRPPPEA